MRLHIALLLPAALAWTLVSCTTGTSSRWHAPSQEPTSLTGAERKLGHVDIDEDWRLESPALTVTRDQSQQQVLRAAGQAGARLTSIRLPHHTRVHTNATADAIYYDAFHDRFELIGDALIEQGSKITHQPGPDGRLMMYSDGTLRFEEVPSLVPPADTDATILNTVAPSSL